MAQDFNKLSQLMLLEEFKSCLTPQMKTYLDERKVDGLSQTTVLADDYSLTHKNNIVLLNLSWNLLLADEKVHRVGNLLQEVIITPVVSV